MISSRLHNVVNRSSSLESPSKRRRQGGDCVVPLNTKTKTWWDWLGMLGGNQHGELSNWTELRRECGGVLTSRSKGKKVDCGSLVEGRESCSPELLVVCVCGTTAGAILAVILNSHLVPGVLGSNNAVMHCSCDAARTCVISGAGGQSRHGSPLRCGAQKADAASHAPDAAGGQGGTSAPRGIRDRASPWRLMTSTAAACRWRRRKKL